MDERLKNQKSELERGDHPGDSSASTRHYAAAGTNLYKGKTKTPRKVNRAVERERDLGSIIQAKESQPNWKPATVSTGCTGALRVFCRLRDYGESEMGIISRNKVNNYLRRNFDHRFLSSAKDHGNYFRK